MGQYLLCGKIAEKPYYVRQLGLRLYSVEELCYYIFHNPALIGEDLIGPELMSFLRQEAGQTELADKIERYYHSAADLDGILLMIQKDVAYYNEIEIAKFQERLSRFRKQNPLEQSRERADQLFDRKKYEGAIREYAKILSGNRDLRLQPPFYAQVLQHMGAAYMRLGLSAEALECFEAAYQETPDPFLLRQMYYYAMETGQPYPKELETVDAVALTEWQRGFMEAYDRNVAIVENERMLYIENEQEQEMLLNRYLKEKKKKYRGMVMEE